MPNYDDFDIDIVPTSQSDDFSQSDAITPSPVSVTILLSMCEGCSETCIIC